MFDAAPAAVRDDTLIVVLGDHGFHLGDHNTWTKVLPLPPPRSRALQHTNFEQATRSPLLIVPPSGQGRASEWRSEAFAGSTQRAPVELLDLMPTLMDVRSAAGWPMCRPKLTHGPGSSWAP